MAAQTMAGTVAQFLHQEQSSPVAEGITEEEENLALPSLASATNNQTEQAPDTGVDSNNDPGTRDAKKPWVGYRIEYRNRYTGDLISERTYEKGDKENDYETDGPVFELITSYRVSTHSLDQKSSMPITSQAQPAYHLRINSIAIINAIQSVVRYYPSQDLSGDSVIIPKPYPVLVHHYDELQQFRRNCASKSAAELCVREVDAWEHLGLLLQFLDDEVMDSVRDEQERNKRGVSTFDWRWVAYKPGITTVDNTPKGWEAGVIHSVTGGTFSNPRKEWKIATWKMSYDGIGLERVWDDPITYTSFDGERSDAKPGEETRFFDPTVENSYLKDEIALGLIENGKKFWSMLRKQCFHHKGKGARFPHNQVCWLQVGVGIFTETFLT